VAFDALLTARIAGALPVIPTAAGHDAGILAAAGVPTAMLFVRNPTGVSHSPREWAERDDCLAGVSALATVLRDLAGEAA
jgi:N-carbamoyl-L-amino-acid hydrolase